MRRTQRWLLALAAWAGLSVAGCGSGGVGTPGDAEPGSPSGGWTREVTPFQVVDEDGEPYGHPFLGGFDVPRPQLIDIDDDGDLDLFIQERSNELMFLENVGTPAEAQFVWRTDRFQDVDIHEWYRFVDMDGDGDRDLLAEQPFSYIRYYRNDGDAATPRFVLAADTLHTVDGEALFSDRQNIPNATDIDCDGRTDLFVGRLTGTVTRYEAVEEAAEVPRFRLVTERFENIEIVANQMGSLHGANTMDFADYDGDGDQDLFWGDFFEAGLLLLENVGSCRSPAIRNTPVPFPPRNPIQTTGYNAPAVGDLDADGRPDMLLGVLGGAYNPILSAHENLYYLHHEEQGFEVRTTRYLRQIDVGSETNPELVDVDGDGDLDLLIGSRIEPEVRNTAYVHYFENVGTTTAPSFRQAGRLPIEGSYHYAPASGDLDGDGDPDLLVGTWNDDVLFYRNTGGGADGWELAGEPLVELTRGSNSTPALGDIDGDGDLDLFVGEAVGALNFYRNEGTATAPRFELVSDEWQGIDVGRRSHPELVDLDDDGDLDLVVGNEDGELRVFRNGGSPSSPAFEEDATTRLPRLPWAAPAFADLDGDGALELVLGGLSGGLVYYRR